MMALRRTASGLESPAKRLRRGGRRGAEYAKKAQAAHPSAETLHFLRDLCAFAYSALKESASAVSARPIQRTGGAYINPPLFHRALRPRGSFSGEAAPTFRWNISP